MPLIGLKYFKVQKTLPFLPGATSVGNLSNGFDLLNSGSIINYPAKNEFKMLKPVALDFLRKVAREDFMDEEEFGEISEEN
ncbi:hypothetical protein RB195_008836 [Necator americanus]|uniref:Uncharacterized protein n=1 Tax=Necator americanus TaxID=51031 RepID=A0ABR1CSD5_NECAM